MTLLKAAFIEASFPNEMDELARIAKHHTPALLAEEFAKLAKPELPVFVFHLKPPFASRSDTNWGGWVFII